MRSGVRAGRIGGLLAAGLVCLVAPAAAGAATIVNGDFETGNLDGWSVADDPAASGDGWRAYNSATAPPAVPAPPEGSFAAITRQAGPGAHLMYQDIALEPGFRHTLSLFVYYRTNASIISPDTLSPAGFNNNEQYRVDVMRPSAAIDSVASDDILLNVFRTVAGDPSTLAPTRVSADLTPFAGQNVRLRFAEVDNAGPLNAGTDAIAIASEDSVAPQTLITKAPKDKLKTKKKKVRVTFEFTGSDPRAVAGFQCSIDGGPFGGCTSPYTVKVKKGNHSFQVRSVDQAGNLSVAATDTFKVKRKKKKKR